jgi:hypothetical protein
MLTPRNLRQRSSDPLCGLHELPDRQLAAVEMFC